MTEHKQIWLSPPDVGIKEQEAVVRVMESGWVAPVGPELNEFEKDLSVYTGSPHAVCLASGTSAIHLALVTLGVKQNDEVIVSSFTFSASANPICYQGAIPVFIDSEKETWNMDPELLKKALKERTSKGIKPKAIILVHLYGTPAKIDEIFSIAKEYDVPVIEDAAESLGSTYKNKATGTFGHSGVLSFNGNKIITTSGGGAFLAPTKELADKIRFLSTQARDPAPHYEHSSIGFNYRMSNVLAGLGRVQLESLEKKIARRREIFDTYKKELAEFEGLDFPIEPAETRCNRWLSTVVFNGYSEGTTEKLRVFLEKEKIESRPLWKPLHLQPIFQDYPSYINGVSEDLFSKGLCLPSGSSLTRDEQTRILSLTKQVLS
jgi:dTDP-4-amino-4,6-dideoxygalactose transaminase